MKTQNATKIAQKSKNVKKGSFCQKHQEIYYEKSKKT
jgi:hypothetical protein